MQRYRGTYGRRRVRGALDADYDMNVNLKLVKSIMTEQGLYGLPRPGRHLPNLIHLNTRADRMNRRFTATRRYAGAQQFSMLTMAPIYVVELWREDPSLGTACLVRHRRRLLGQRCHEVVMGPDAIELLNTRK
jgi:helix-turn-helix protein